MPDPKSKKNTLPQQAINKFWKRFTAPNSGKPFTILPGNPHAKHAALTASWNAEHPRNAVVSYQEAAAACTAEVERIVRDCRRVNQKHKDPQFDIEQDFMMWLKYQRTQDCLVPLNGLNDSLEPRSVKRVEDIFEKPQFSPEGLTASEARQGRLGNCWFISSVSTLINSEDLLKKVCVARDEKVGVYGFVFHRDGEWIHEVIDDKLYLAQEDFHESGLQRHEWLRIDMPNPDEQYRKVMQTGSNALWGARCKNQNATWLPLLEKAYAKAHGDYGSTVGGWVGEGLEDLTGGVTSELFTTDILDKDKFWKDELMNVNKLFLFGLSQMGGLHGKRHGIIEGHAYSIMEVRELDDFRLLKIRNPWGVKEGVWDGPWSNGSEEWTSERMSRLNHTFDDGVFWISYPDLLKHFQQIDRTRLFGADWFVTQHWTSADIPWAVRYLDTRFRVTISKASPVVIMLCQLDDRYFRGLEGQYEFRLEFELHKDGQKEYVARNKPSYFMVRSVTTELNLDAGQYTVMVRITASRDKSIAKPEEVVAKNAEARRDKFMAVGKRYDIAHAKSGLQESGLEREECLRRERREKRKLTARKAFEARRLEQKKEKLRRLRREAREKAKKSKEPEKKEQKSGDGADGTTIQIKMGGATLEPTECRKADEAGTGSKMVAHTGYNKEVKITIETSDHSKPEGSGDQTTPKEQVPGAGDTKRENTEQAPAGPQHQNPEIEKQEKNIDSNKVSSTTTTATTNPNPNTPSSSSLPPPPPPPPPPEELTLNDISDDALSWSSDIDAPSDSDTTPEQPESDSDSDPEPSINETKEGSGKSSAKSEDPWNAVCVFGLRVYAREAQAEIAVVRGGGGGGKREEGDNARSHV